MPDITSVSFENEDALFDLVPYRPWHSPLGTEPAGVDPGDRRMVGRVGVEPVSITDLPPHIVHRSDPPGYAHTHQYFERAGDFYDWVSRTASGTRFVGAGAEWDDRTQYEVAARAVRVALEWDSDGNILVMSPPGHTTPLMTTPEIEQYRLHPTSTGQWEVRAGNGGHPALVGAGLTRVLDSTLHDVCCGGDPFAFEIEVQADEE